MNERITEAERAIAAILKQLEIDTGNMVGDLCVRDVGIESMSGTRTLHRTVQIDMLRVPGTSWGV